MELVPFEHVDGWLLEPAWALYTRSFAELAGLAAQRHVMTRDEFDAVMADPRVTKWLVLDGDRRALAGLATVTDDLAAVPLVSPEYYARRWPAEYAEQRIWYVGFLAVSPPYEGAGVSSLLVRGVSSSVVRTGGLVAVDICAHNESLKLPTLLLRLARTYSAGTTLRRLDTQTFWAYEVPAGAGS